MNRLPTFTPASLPLTAHGIKRTGPAKVSGAHLSDAANEPEPDEAALLAADFQRSQNKAQRFHQQNDAAALDLQVMSVDAMRRAGWL